MATFLNQVLSYEISGSYVMFNINVELKFKQDEIGKEWRIEPTILEKDRLSPDDKFFNKYWIRTIYARKEKIKVELNIPILKVDLNTEPGKEEVYAELRVISLDGQLVISETTTDIIKVEV